MGYTHYWTMPSEISEDGWRKSISTIKKVVAKHRKLLAYEVDQPLKPPRVTNGMVHFNGIDEEGHETFMVEKIPEAWNFCKTVRKPYDQAVCECLLVFKAFLPGFSLSSDGFSGSLKAQKIGIALDGTWNEAVEAVKAYGINFKGVIVNERDPYCDLDVVLEEAGIGTLEGKVFMKSLTQVQVMAAYRRLGGDPKALTATHNPGLRQSVGTVLSKARCVWNRGGTMPLNKNRLLPGGITVGAVIIRALRSVYGDFIVEELL